MLAVVVSVVGAVLGNVLSKGAERKFGWDVPRESPTDPPTGEWVLVDSVAPLQTEEEGFSWLFPEPLKLDEEQLAQANRFARSDPDALAQWWRRLGGVDPGNTHAKIALRGNAVKPVRIMDMRALNECRSPLTGALALSPPAGLESAVKVGFDLDQPQPHARTVDEDGRWGGPYFSDQTITLEREETLVLHIVGAVKARYCEFRLEVRLLMNGQEKVQVIDDNGVPFKVSSFVSGSNPNAGENLDVYRELYVGGIASPPHGAWVKADPETWKFPSSEDWSRTP
ncbi:hypothetical protein ABGB12_16290 [Actinocorallia sp. B10E7]|uniref:hypothetical protein n=1 Tax=Actinocorallia sp. B10E7 TaxID=3153558 RepID=UPI00325E6BDA